MNSSSAIEEGLSRRRRLGSTTTFRNQASCYNPLLRFLSKDRKKRNRLFIFGVVFGLLLLSTSTLYSNNNRYSISSQGNNNLVVNKELIEKIATKPANVTTSATTTAAAVTTTTTTSTIDIIDMKQKAVMKKPGIISESSNTVPSLLLPTSASNPNNNNNTSSSKNPTTSTAVTNKKIIGDDNNDSHYQQKRVIYSFARTDRSGSAIQDMLFCHAYAFQHNLKYGGACASNWELPQYIGKRNDRELLLKAIGLLEELPFACPTPATSDNNNSTNTKKLINRKLYTEKDTLIFTPKYQKYIHSIVKYPLRRQHGENQKLIVVHIRRGDIDPCRPRTYGYPRYIPNLQYLKLIDRYYDTNNNSTTTKVKIFSESTSYENFDLFHERGYDVILDGDIGLVWQSIIDADITILSRSSFSFVPAILSKGIVVYTPFWHKPLQGWHIVDDTLLNETHTEFRRLKSMCPPKDKNNKKKKNKKKNQDGGGGGKQ